MRKTKPNNAKPKKVNGFSRWLKRMVSILKSKFVIVENGIWSYHGTNKENAIKIIKEGFAVGTHFAHHLEDALEFGGSWVFMVKWKNKPQNWQFLNKKKIPPERIHRLTQYRPIVRIGTQPHLTRKTDSMTEHFNLLGKPLKC